eukprot:8104340-Pyramimonas_sp.AAC.1
MSRTARLPVLIIRRRRRFRSPPLGPGPRPSASFGGGKGIATEVPADAAPVGIGGSGGLRECLHGS